MFLLALVAALGAASACSAGPEESQFVGACSRSQVDDRNGSKQKGSAGRWGPGVKHAEAKLTAAFLRNKSKMQGDSPREDRRESLAAKEAWLPPSLDRQATRGFQRAGTGWERGGERQAEWDGRRRVVPAQHVFIGTWGTSRSVSGGANDDLVPWCDLGRVPLWAASRTLALSDARGSPVSGTVAWHRAPIEEFLGIEVGTGRDDCR
jgi:hypothetical protein